MWINGKNLILALTFALAAGFFQPLAMGQVQQAPCVEQPLSNYIGNPCVSGYWTYKVVRYDSWATGGAKPVPASEILASPTLYPGRPLPPDERNYYGLIFTANAPDAWKAGPGQTQVSEFVVRIYNTSGIVPTFFLNGIEEPVTTRSGLIEANYTAVDGNGGSISGANALLSYDFMDQVIQQAWQHFPEGTVYPIEMTLRVTVTGGADGTAQVHFVLFSNGNV